MRRVVRTGLFLGVLAGSVFGLAVPSGAAPHNTIPGLCKALYPGTVGECIAGVFYGNTSNPSGNGNGVLPSLAPGPWKCVYTAGCTGAEMGSSIGTYNGGGTAVGHSNGEFPFDVRTNAIYG